MSLYMLDTDVCIELMRGRAGSLLKRLRKYSRDEIGISSITFGELQYGAAKSSRPFYHAALLAEFCAPLMILPFDSVAAESYGPIRASLQQSGTPIGALDTLIAAHAVSQNVTLISRNLRDFRRVARLRVENWL